MFYRVSILSFLRGAKHGPIRLKLPIWSPQIINPNMKYLKYVKVKRS